MIPRLRIRTAPVRIRLTLTGMVRGMITRGGAVRVEDPTEYPSGLTVEEFTDDLGSGSTCHGFIVTVDFSSNPNLRFNVTYTVPKKTPTEIYSEFDKDDKGWPFIVVNGGYFSGTSSMSLAVIDGSIKDINCHEINWPSDENYQQTVYPVRSALGQMPDGSFEAHWAYPAKYPFFRDHYKFPSALDNDEKTRTFMTEAPTDEYPGAEPWSPQEAIGGGPRLLLDGENVAEENYWKEVFDAGGTAALTRQPRTGIGYTPDNKLVLIVCDGRSMNGSSGFTCPELADKFLSLGVENAINLDGGGSSQIVGLGGEVLNRPSDSGTTGAIVERTLVTAVVISEL